MAYLPDYGLRLLNEGIKPTLDLCFYDLRLNSVIVLGHRQYSTMVQMSYAGALHALSLDYNATQLKHILVKATPGHRTFIKAQLAADPATPRAIDFEEVISFGVRARLGVPQQNDRESYVPLITQEIL